MRFLLINVPVREDRLPSNFPTGPGIIAAVLRDGGHEVKILDINGHRYKPNDVLNLASSSAADAIGISGLVSTYKYQCWLAKELKERLPHVPLISGGGCATSVPEQLLRHAPYDILAMGEGEWTALELADALETGQPLQEVNGVVLRQGDGILRTPVRPVEENLDAFPLPAYDLFPTECYAKNKIWHFPDKSMNLVSSRGCPMDCHFCYNLFGKRSYRKRGVDSLVEEVQLLKREYGVKQFAFVDDNLTINRKHLFTVCDALAKENIEWGCHGRVDTVDDERLEKMAASGCRWLGFGIESGNQRILDAMKKRATVEQAHAAVQRCRKHKIFANATFIHGYPGEDEESARDSLRFKIEADIVNDGFYATPYPGTELYELARKKGLIPDEHEFLMNLNNAYDFTINMTSMSDEQLINIKKISIYELRMISVFLYSDIPVEKEADFLNLADQLLNQESFVPEFRGYILLGLSRYYQMKGNWNMAFTTRNAARQFGVHRLPRSRGNDLFLNAQQEPCKDVGKSSEASALA